MTAAEAVWVREHAWTGAMRKTYKEVPGFYTRCACEWSGPCLNDPRRPGVHETCHMGTPIYNYETIISVRGGVGVAAFKQPYRYPTASATGWHLSPLAMVWIADRRCRWQCTCPCDHRRDVAHAPECNPMRPIRYEVVELPGLLEAVGR
ncbi:DUF6248 family natural product biosynthesis protein [Streptosporangium sp. NPDC001559]|uniref:DUF6248 family natural product biosynthesis protein n=1 Tax=Streptosporangium sp. NPDC001559 TaxID=3366187 RepID=UPI0036EC9684